MICLLCLFKDHLQNNALYEKFQSGFRPYHTAEAALLRVSDDLHMYGLLITTHCQLFYFWISHLLFTGQTTQSWAQPGEKWLYDFQHGFCEFSPYVTTSTNWFNKQDGIFFFILLHLCQPVSWKWELWVHALVEIISFVLAIKQR